MKKIFTFALLGFALSGCNDNSGHSIKMSPKLAWGDLIGQEIALGGDCHIDSINDKPGEGTQSHVVKQHGSGLKVVGWNAISVRDGVMASDVAIALRSNSKQGASLFVAPNKEKRKDVADYFKNSASIETGFSAEIDLSDVIPGNYVLEVIQHKDGKNLKCSYTANIIIEK